MAKNRTVRELAFLAILLSLLLKPPSSPSQDALPTLNEKEPTIQRLQPRSPDQALQTFSLRDGFRIDLLASEPLLRDPVCITYDADGAMYVVEMTAYPHPDRGDEIALGQVRFLLDDDGDGDYDRSFLFADKLSTPTSVTCWKGGVLVVAPPDLWYLKDSNGDHRADVRKKIISGFGISNAEQLANNLKWGIDNKIYGASSHSGGNLQVVEPSFFATRASQQEAPPEKVAEKSVSIARQDFRLDPRTGQIEPLTWATSRWGNSFDDSYNRFVCQNTGPARHVVLPRRYLSRNPYLRTTSVYQSLAKEGGTEPVFRTSPPEPWRLVRAHRRQALGKPANPGEINATGYFTASCGITIYRGDAYPKKYRGNLFVGDAAGNLVHRRTLASHGVTFESKRADIKAEFLASSDNFFRPVNFINAPDGTLHVVDMYREVVEGPSWVPEDLKKQGLVDVHGATDRGRVYRLAPAGFKVPKPPRLAKTSTVALVPYLEHANAWFRETAQRLLVERQDRTAVEPLRQMVSESQLTFGRLHAMWTLAGLDGLRDEDLLRSVTDQSALVREHAALLVEPRLAAAGPWSAQRKQLLTAVLKLASDESPRVRFQVALTLGEIQHPDTVAALAHIIQRDLADPWMRTAALSSVTRVADQLLVHLLARRLVVDDLAGQAVLKELALMSGGERTTEELDRVLMAIAQQTQRRPLQYGLMVQLLAGQQLKGRQATLRKLANGLIEDLLPHARKTAGLQTALPVHRADAIALLAFDKAARVQSLLTSLVDASQPQEVQVAAVRTLSRFDEPTIANGLLNNWAATTPGIRNEIITMLMLRETWIDSLLVAIGQKRVLVSEVDSATRSRLVAHTNAAIKKQAAALFAEDVVGVRHEVIKQYQPALQLAGDAARGKAIFLRECIGCHRFGSQGHDVGPNLSNYGRQKLPPASLMTQILDPNRLVATNYISYIVVLKDGRVLNGIITDQTPTSVTIKRDKDVRVTILRQEIDAMKSSGKSLMPEGLEKKVNHQQMADLLEFLTTVNQRI